jgi:hypothetical protein
VNRPVTVRYFPARLRDVENHQSTGFIVENRYHRKSMRRNYRFLRRAGMSAAIVRSLLLDAYATGAASKFHWDSPKPALVDRVDAARSAGEL